MCNPTKTMQEKLNKQHKIVGDIEKSIELLDKAARDLSAVANLLFGMQDFEFSQELKAASEQVSALARQCDTHKGEAQGKYNNKYGKYIDICTTN